jgi:molybdopterin molybdotransferase
MDGYAVRAADTEGASQDNPVVLRVVADLAAGGVWQGTLEPGTAIRIMTGAPIPDGADAVVQFENTDEGTRPADAGERAERAEVSILSPASPRLNVRDAGEDIKEGELVLAKGTVLRPSEIGVLASLGYPTVFVYRRPWVAVIATGDELTPLGTELEPGKIYNSNSYSIASLAKHYGAIPAMFDIVRDKREELADALKRATGADFIITTGGVSMGDFDMVKNVLASEGDFDFWRVRMKPGKPIAFGKIGGVPVLGLPGNPVSAMVTFEMFARPAILKMLGKSYWHKPAIEATLLDGDRNRDGRRVYLRAHVEKRDGEYFASLTGPQGSGILTSMSAANGLAIIPEDVAEVKAGDKVQVLMLDWPEDPAH